MKGGILHNMQKNDVISLDYISWDEKLWKKYLKSLKRTYRWVTSERMGELRISGEQQNSEFQIQVIVKSALSDLLDRYRPIVVEVSMGNVLAIISV